MDKQGNKWVFNCNNMSDEYFYKYLINDGIRINDPSSKIYMPDNKGELWSYLNINEEGKRKMELLMFTYTMVKIRENNCKSTKGQVLY